eukprot:gnl/MRDRNA2_/MRDRNA2_73615_c0_seq1.p1 gnl/MRDRNA2_/MRDRNA2_73615_c0~~gnl/MRDRNA2_/MRDRNA2_73615_c0_seq1.p1  ORF type:complete len:313 (+),score=39.87 gnl/MRDRNA2_/MRDRNA2_73615_c0_seq1:70-939(+)
MALDSFAVHQWKRYLGFCGKWKGSWHRFSPGSDGQLKPTSCFQGICVSKPDDDSRSVRHLNYYEAGTVPVGGKPTGREVDGLQEVDFGSFDEDNFRHPFGPASLAAYHDDCAVVASAQVNPWPPKMFAVEFLTLSSKPRERRRAVAVWKPDSGDASQSSPVLELATVTIISDHEEGQDPRSSESCDCDAGAEIATWPAQRIALNVADGEEMSDSTMAGWASGGCWELIAGVADCEVWVPRHLTLEALASGNLSLGLSWRRAKDEVLRVGVAYDKEGQLAHLVREVLCQP